MDNWGKLNETTLPEKEEFYSNLTLSQAGFFKLFKGGWGGIFGPQQKNYYKTCSFHPKPMKLDMFVL